MEEFPLAAEGPKHAFRRVDADVEFGCHELDRRTQHRAFRVRFVGFLDFFVPAADVIDDGEVLGAVGLHIRHRIQFIRHHIQFQHKSHQRGEESKLSHERSL